ncbi:hypothetical protein CCY99_02265 [Helicobacter sp. 16-1353]|uniref:HNH endonuclease family protein n=1 Tax=Helicobacter sp. 16-1353 TaxID=2004996 RepID=UPI000DCB573E|nr:HNH endonuclease family protein [Helicobacter sp. 16-1353]RAX54983.1 hypothetical protein CCY99_02265 [Helicobacter sp. 16-1353]
MPKKIKPDWDFASSSSLEAVFSKDVRHDSKLDSSEIILSDMLSYSKIYTLFLNPNDDKVLQDSLSHFKVSLTPTERKKIIYNISFLVDLKFGTSYPFVMKIFDDFLCGNLGFDELDSIFRILHSYIIRVNFCENSNVLNKTLYPLYRQMSEMNETSKVIAMQKVLSKDAAHFANNKRFREFFNELVFSNKNRNLIKRILLAIECNTNKESPKEADLTIEHIYPQNPGKFEKEWHKMAKDWEDIEWRNWHHTMGNLTLSGINSKLSNRPFADKKKIMAESGNLHINKYFENINTWDLEAIKSRSEWLFNQVIEIFEDLPEEFREEAREMKRAKGSDYINLLDEEFEVTNKKPVALILPDSKEIRVDSWKEVHHKIAEFLYDNCNDDFMECVEKSIGGVSFESRSKQHDAVFKKDSRIIITGGSAIDITQKIQKLLESCGFDEDDGFGIEVRHQK